MFMSMSLPIATSAPITTHGPQLKMVQLKIFQIYNGGKVICIISYMRYSILYYQIGFVLGDVLKYRQM